jgi:hypothetical protein
VAQARLKGRWGFDHCLHSLPGSFLPFGLGGLIIFRDHRDLSFDLMVEPDAGITMDIMVPALVAHPGFEQGRPVQVIGMPAILFIAVMAGIKRARNRQSVCHGLSRFR